MGGYQGKDEIYASGQGSALGTLVRKDRDGGQWGMRRRCGGYL